MKKLSLKIVVIIIVVIVLGGAIFFLFFNKKSPQTAGEDKTGNEIIGQEKTFEITAAKNKENNIYTDSQYNFSFEYPKDFTATKFGEGEDGDTILVQKQGSKEGFQIFISPFDEPGPLTEERVKQDLPDLKMESPEQRVLKITVDSGSSAPSGVEGLIFFSEEASLGKTREIWFIQNGFLYQVSTYKEFDSLVAKILETWRFQE